MTRNSRKKWELFEWDLFGRQNKIHENDKSQQAAEEILESTSKLREVEDCKDIYIKKNRNEE